MRRSYNMMLAVAMVFSMFIGVAFAAEKTDKQLLGEAGIIIGGTSGESLDDSSWKREDVVVLLTRLYGKTEQEMKNTAKTHTFTDVSNTYYDGFISWAVGEKIVNGRNDAIFGFGDVITAQEFAALLLRVVGTDFEYANAIKTAVALGIMAKTLPNNSEVSRNVSYEGIVNSLNSTDDNNVSLGEKLGLMGWIPEDHASEKPPVSGNNGADTSIVEVTLAEEFLLGASFDEVAESAKLAGIDEVVLNADQSITFRMTKEKHTELIHEMKQEVYSWMDKMVDYLDSVSKITINDAFTEMSVSANENEFTSRGDIMQFLGISFQIAWLQMYDLVEPADVQFKILYINEDTGVIFNSDELEINL